MKLVQVLRGRQAAPACQDDVHLHRTPKFAPLARCLLPPAAACLLLLSACAGREQPFVPPATALAMEGPPLAIIGEYAGMRLEGYMDRGCMTGYGRIGLRAVSPTRQGDLAVDILPVEAPSEEEQTKETPQAKRPSPPPPLTLNSYPLQAGPSTNEPQAAAPGQEIARSQTPQMPPANSPGLLADARRSANGNKILRLPAYPTQEKDAAPKPALSQASNAKIKKKKEAVPGGSEFICKSDVDAPPTEKGRIRGLLLCSGDRSILFSLRNIGPDQGVGVGKDTQTNALMVLFYHTSIEEARRRFPAVQADIRKAYENQ